jgi:HK97 family phage prohead protease
MPNELTLQGTLQIRDEDKREVECFVLPWDTDAETARGLERFEKGSFEGIDPSRFVFRQRHQDPPTGRGIELSETAEGLTMAFKIAKTAAGDEQLELIREGVEAGVSVGFEDGKFDRKKAADGRMQWFHKRVNETGQLEVSTTWKPAFSQAAVLNLREVHDVADEQEADVATTEQPAAPVATFSEPQAISDLRDALMSRLDKLDQKQQQFAVAAIANGAPKAASQFVRNVDIQIRELAEVVTGTNLGVVPDAFSSEVIGRIDEGRPFLNTTRQVPTPPAGMNLVLPKITQTPLVGAQAAEKDEVASRATAITTVDFPLVTYAGAGDLSIQLIKRSSPDFLALWTGLLADAYALATEDAAVDSLLAETVVVEGTGTFDVETDSLGEAFGNTIAANRSLKPNRIWMSTTALIQFVNARSPSGGGGEPLYPSLSAIGGFSAGGTNPLGFQLQPVWVPALDNEVVDIIIGPSNGFLWAEDGTYQLTADVPAKAGRDVGIVGMLFFAPVYPAAFTTYVVAT